MDGKIQDVRDSIIGTARELFARYGFKKTTLNDIAKVLGKTKSSIYYYFKNKDEIFQAVAYMEIAKGKEELKKVAVLQVPPDERFVFYITARISVIQSISSYYNFPADVYFENYRLIERLRDEINKEELLIISGILEEGTQQGLFSIENVAFTAMNILNILKGLEYPYMKEEKEGQRLKSEIDNLSVLFLRGMLKR
jgi:AcrR family transcriptional regulator